MGGEDGEFMGKAPYIYDCRTCHVRHRDCVGPKMWVGHWRGRRILLQVPVHEGNTVGHGVPLLWVLSAVYWALDIGQGKRFFKGYMSSIHR